MTRLYVMLSALQWESPHQRWTGLSLGWSLLHIAGGVVCFTYPEYHEILKPARVQRETHRCHRVVAARQNL
jgi:hypothetical protein